MNNLGKVVARIGLLSLFCVMPLTAQSGVGVKFTAPFAFYVGNTRMPSGSYQINQPDDDFLQIIKITSIDARHTATILIIPTQSLEPPKQSKVIFEKFGGNLYLDKVLVDGSTSGVMTEPTKAEKRAEETASVEEEHSVTVYGQ
jgi:hypothetical protein